jgi:RimJ/RimL family protein N-acetyltransferase
MKMNKINTITTKNPFGNKIEMDVVRFYKNDFQILKNFILGVWEKLEDRTHFITDDIDSVFPILLKEGYGLVYGIVYKEEIIAVQAMDYDINKSLDFYELLEIDKSNNIMEIGWAIVNPLYRRNSISTNLVNILEKAANLETRNKICIATVHPDNISSLFLFLRSGYVGVKLTNHYNVIRLVMIKRIDLHFPINPTQESIIIKNDDHKQLMQLMENGYLCNGIFSEDNNIFLKFVKASFKCLFRLNKEPME